MTSDIADERQLFILGTCHTLQCGCEPFSDADIVSFQNFVRDLCQSKKIKFVAEEMSEDGLKSHSVQSTVIRQLVSDRTLNVEIAYVDVDTRVRNELGIGDFGLRAAAIPRNGIQPDQYLENLYRSHLVDAIRECSWISQIISKNSWPTLLVCGADHVTSVEGRAKEVSLKAIVVRNDYQP